MKSNNSIFRFSFFDTIFYKTNDKILEAALTLAQPKNCDFYINCQILGQSKFFGFNLYYKIFLGCQGNYCVKFFPSFLSIYLVYEKPTNDKYCIKKPQVRITEIWNRSHALLAWFAYTTMFQRLRKTIRKDDKKLNSVISYHKNALMFEIPIKNL